MRIVFVCDTMSSGGAERVISSLSNEFDAMGHQVSIVMLSSIADGSFYKLNEGIVLAKLPKDEKKLSFFKKSKMLRKELENLNPDIVISFLSYVCIYTWWALKGTNIPYIVSERNDPNQRNRIKQLLLNQAFKHASGCVFQTEDALSWYKRIIKNNGTIIYNPVKLTYTPVDLKPRRKQILFVGRLTEQKNCSLLIESFNLFVKKHQDYTLKIIGDGPLKEQLDSLIVDKGLIDKVFIYETSKTWQEEECDSSIFALASKYEGMPNVLAESLCLGIPSVSTNCTIGGPKELQKLFPSRLILSSTMDASSVAEAMEKALNIPLTLPSIPNNLNIAFIANKWIDYIKTLVRR